MPALSTWNTPTVSPRPAWRRSWDRRAGSSRCRDRCPLADQLHRRRDGGQCLEAEEVEIHKAGLLHPFHIVLGDRHVGLGGRDRAAPAHAGPVADHDARRVGGGVSVEAFEAHGDVEGLLDHLLLVARLLKARLFLDGLLQRDGIGGVLRHQLAELVHLAIGHFQHTADVAQHAARLKRTEGDDLRHLRAPVALLHIVDHLLAAVLTEVHVEVRMETRSGLRKRSNSRPKRSGSRSVIWSE